MHSVGNCVVSPRSFLQPSHVNMPSLDTNVGRFTEYQVIGRKLPTEKEPEPKLYRMVRCCPS